jgi:hypothetical protein
MVVLAQYFVATYAPMAACQPAIWWSMVFLTAMLLVVQFWTFFIYAHVWRTSCGSACSLLPSVSCGEPSRQLGRTNGSGDGSQAPGSESGDVCRKGSAASSDTVGKEPDGLP